MVGFLAGDDVIYLAFGGMCILDWQAFCKYNPATGAWDFAREKFRKYCRKVSNTGFNAAPLSPYCAGRELALGMKELCQPWAVNAANKVDFLLPLNDKYFAVLFDDVISIMNECGLEANIKLINQCDFNYENRREYTPFNPERNVQKIDKFWDPKAFPIVKALIERLLTEGKKRKSKLRVEFGNEIDNKDAAPLLENIILPTVKAFGYRGENCIMGARLLLGKWLNKLDAKGREMYDYGGRYDAQYAVRRMVTKIFGKPDDDLCLRPIHGIMKDPVKERGGLGHFVYQAMDELGDFAFLFSDDGWRKVGETPEFWAKIVDFIFKHKKMKSPFVSKKTSTGGKLSKINFEHLMSFVPGSFSDSNPSTPDEWIQVLEEKEIPILKAIVATIKKNTGWKLINEGKYPDLPDAPPPPGPGDPPPPPAGKPPFNWKGFWNNNKKMILAGIGLILLVIIGIIIF